MPRYIRVRSTILTLAAAKNRTRHMKLLLERGWDVNAASAASAQAYLDAGIGGAYFFGPPYGFGGLEASSITVGAALYSSVNGSSRIASELWNSGRCTPLAAAIACGSVEAAALLLRQPGVRTLESSAVCRAAAAAVRGNILNLCSGSLHKRSGRALLARWKELCGEERDISELSLYLSAGQEGDRELQTVLRALGEGGTLCAGTESGWLWECDSRARLRLAVSRVRFYRSAPEGLSTLAALLLKQCDQRLLREAASRGALDGEPREAMLARALCQEQGFPLRAAILSLPAASSPAPPAPDTNEETREAWLRELWTEPLDAAECLRRMRSRRFTEPEPDARTGLISFTQRASLFENSACGLSWNDIRAVACCGANPGLLLAVLEKDGARVVTDAQVHLSLCFETRSLTATLLCAAAAAGRTEQVRILLDRGSDPNERDAPERSRLCEGVFNVRAIVTPLEMALRGGHRETAALLRERGAN